MNWFQRLFCPVLLKTLETERLKHTRLISSFNMLVGKYNIIQKSNTTLKAELKTLRQEFDDVNMERSYTICDFKSVNEFREFSRANKIDEKDYTSVTFDCFAIGTPILCKIQDVIDIKTIDDLSVDIFFNDVYVLNHEKTWVKVNWITSKKTDKISYQFAQTSSITLTSDHKVKQNGKYIAAIDCDKIDSIEMCENLNNNNNDIPKGLAWLFGLFFSDGHCRMNSSGSTYVWKISNCNKEYLERAKKIANVHLPGKYDIVLYNSEKKGVPRGGIIPKENMYQLIVTFNNWGGGRFTFGQTFRKMFYAGNGNKKVPFEILHSAQEIKESFLDGVVAGDGDKSAYKEKEFMRITSGGEIGSFGLILLAKSINYNVDINREKRNANVLYLTFYKGNRKFKEKDIKRKYPTKQKQVWDINVDGGELIVANYLVHNCDDFARATQKAAEQWRGGRRMNCQYKLTDGGKSAHMLNTIFIGNKMYEFEPQTDRLTFFVNLD